MFPKPRTSEGHQLICELHSEILHLQASAVQPDPTPDFVIQDVRFGVRLQEAMIGSQKANIKSPQKDSEATQDSLNNWDEGDLHSIEAVHGRITEPPVSHPPQAGRGHEQLQRKEHSVPMRSAQIFRYDVPKAAPKLAAAPSTPPAGNLKDPPTVPNTSTPTTTLPTETTAPTVTIPDYGGHKKKKPNTLLMTSGLNRQNSEVGKSASKAKSLILRNIPEPLCHGLEKLRMRKVLTSSSLQHLYHENQYRTSRALIARLQADPGKSSPKTSRNKSPQPKEKLNLRSDTLRADELPG